MLGMAAHLEGKGVGIIDMAGLAQKGGAVYSHIRIAERPEDIHAIRVAAGGADLVLGCDIVVAGNKKVLAAVKHGADRDRRQHWPSSCPATSPATPISRCRPSGSSARSRPRPGASNAHFVEATRLATALLGKSIAANMFMLGYAWQRRACRSRRQSIEQAIELNGEAVAMNQAAFRWGRRAAVDPAAVEALIAPAPAAPTTRAGCRRSLDEIDRAARRLPDRLSERAPMPRATASWSSRRKAAEAEGAPGQRGLAEAVARYLFKLMANKDEYEVARLYTDGAFQRQVANEFGGDDLRFQFHLAPPLLARSDKATGEPRKMTFGPWILTVFGLLAKFKGLRGTFLDPFGYTAERRTERELVRHYEAMLGEILAKLTPDNHHLAVGLAAIPEKIRGFGHVKARHLTAAKADEAALLDQFRAGPPPLLKAAE